MYILTNYWLILHMFEFITIEQLHIFIKWSKWSMIYPFRFMCHAKDPMYISFILTIVQNKIIWLLNNLFTLSIDIHSGHLKLLPLQAVGESYLTAPVALSSGREPGRKALGFYLPHTWSAGFPLNKPNQSQMARNTLSVEH